MIVTNVTKFTTICEIFDLRKKFFSQNLHKKWRTFHNVRHPKKLTV
jgi:hypothetical protein